MTAPPHPIHAGLVARRLSHGWAGVLLVGAAGRGKSDLALRLLSRGWRLVADDRVVLWVSGGRLFGRSPPALRGLLEVRHCGIVREPFLEMAPIVAMAECVAADADLERIPSPARAVVLGVALSQIAVRASEASAVEKVARLLAATHV